MLSRYAIAAVFFVLAIPLLIPGCATQPPSQSSAAEDEATRLAKREAAEREAERQRNEALQKLLAESPALSEQGFKYDISTVGNLTDSQQEALSDAGLRVVLTTDEEKELA